jgi:DNA-binding MarR family transcriptional regulator
MASKKLSEAYIPLQCMIINSLSEFHLEEVGNAQYYILESLNNGSKTAKEIAEERGTTQSAISKLNKKLLEKGYIVQERSLEDRRYYKLSITDEGKGFLRRAAHFRGNIMNAIENALTKEEIATFAMLCDKITGTKR